METPSIPINPNFKNVLGQSMASFVMRQVQSVYTNHLLQSLTSVFELSNPSGSNDNLIKVSRANNDPQPAKDAVDAAS